MKSIVIYDSKFGNTENIAQTIAGALGAYGPSLACAVRNASMLDVEGVDLIVFGSPTQAWNATQSLRDFLARMPRGSFANRAAAAFDTRLHGPALLTGSAARLIAGDLKRAGCDVLVPAESFFVRGTEGPLDDAEAARAANWARQVHAAFEQRHPQPEAVLAH